VSVRCLGSEDDRQHLCRLFLRRSEHQRQVPKDFYRAAAARVMASYGFVSALVLYTTRACTDLSLSLYDRIKNNFVSLAASLKRKPALTNDRQSDCIASCERARKALRKVLERKRFLDIFLPTLIPFCSLLLKEMDLDLLIFPSG